MKTVMVTGASGFIGHALCLQLIASGWHVRAAVRDHAALADIPVEMELAVVGSLGPDTDWTECLRGVDVIFHLAARVHVLRETAPDPLDEFLKVNLKGTERLVSEALSAGVKRFVFMSSIGVNGDNSADGAYSESSLPYPRNFYSLSKYEAEQVLSHLSSETGMESVIVRPPLVYGPRNPGNFMSLLKVIQRGIPLPFTSINNERSFIYVGNLVDALITCAVHPEAAGETFLVSDGEDISTPDLIRRTALALDVPARLFPFPPSLMHFAGRLAGKRAVVSRLLDSLSVDSSKIRQKLGWKPPFTMEEGLRETAKWFKTCSTHPHRVHI